MDLKQMLNGGAKVPIDNGNLFPLSKRLKAIENNSILFYQLYLHQLDYFSNLYEIKGDKDIEKFSPLFIRGLVEYGKMFLTKKGGKYIPLSVVDYESDLADNFEKGKGINANLHHYKGEMATIDVSSKNSVLFKWNVYGYPLLFRWSKWIDKIENLLNIAETSAIVSVKKWKFSVKNNDSQAIAKEIASMMDPKTGWVTEIANPQLLKKGDQPSNKITTEKMDNTSNMSSLFDPLNDFLKFVYSHEGRRINTNEKKERSITGELSVEQSVFDILERETGKMLERAIAECNETFGLNLTIQRNFDALESEGKDVLDEDGKGDKDGDKE